MCACGECGLLSVRREGSELRSVKDTAIREPHTHTKLKFLRSRHMYTYYMIM